MSGSFFGVAQGTTNFDLSRLFSSIILDTDASNQGIGAVLSQQDEGSQEHVVAYSTE